MLTLHRFTPSLVPGNPEVGMKCEVRLTVLRSLPPVASRPHFVVLYRKSLSDDKGSSDSV